MSQAATGVHSLEAAAEAICLIVGPGHVTALRTLDAVIPDDRRPCTAPGSSTTPASWPNAPCVDKDVADANAARHVGVRAPRPRQPRTPRTAPDPDRPRPVDLLTSEHRMRYLEIYHSRPGGMAPRPSTGMLGAK